MWFPRNGSIIQQIWSNKQLLIEVEQIEPRGGYSSKMSTFVIFHELGKYQYSTSHLISDCLEGLESGDFSFFNHGGSNNSSK